MFDYLLDSFPWKIHKGRDLPSEFQRFLSDAELAGEAMGGRVHWSILFKPFMITLGGLLVCFLLIHAMPANASGVAAVLVLAIPGFCLYFIWAFIEWRRDLIFITGKRVITVTGIIARNVSMLPLGKLTDMSYSRNIPGLLLGYGSFRMETAGQVQAIEMLRRIPHPDTTYRHVQNLLFAGGPTETVIVGVKPGTKIDVGYRGKFVRDRHNKAEKIVTMDDDEWYDG